MSAAPSLKDADVLSEMHMELCRTALNLKPYDGDARQSFVDAARQLLDAVPSASQRLAWSIQLSLACTLGMNLHGIPGEFDVAQLWERET